MTVERLEWDSVFFGIEVGRIRLEAQDDVAAVQRLINASPCEVVYLLLDEPSNDRIREIERIAPLRDRKVTYSKPVCAGVCETPSSVAVYEGCLTPQLRALAVMSGEYSRYNLDPRFRPFFEKLYTTWIERSLSGEIADSVLVTRSGSRLSGFITLAKNDGVGQIGLVAVHPDFRGQGVATALMRASDAWFCAQGCKSAVVVTQRVNSAACNLYKKNGYAVQSETAIFHFWKSGGENE